MLMLLSTRGDLKTLQITGDYYPFNKGFDFGIDLDKLRLNIIYPYLDDNLDDISGIVSGNLNLNGNFEDPVMNGDLNLQKSKFRYFISSDQV